MAYFLFAKKILNKETITLFNDGNMQRDMTHISDIVSGTIKSINHLFAMDDDHEVFNLGNNKPIKTKYLLELLEHKLDRSALVETKESTLEVLSTHADLTKSNKIFKILS